MFDGTLIIMRGLSGSGKTTYAKAHYPDAVRASADDFFVGEDGVYRWDAKRLGEAHAECIQKVIASLTLGAPVIVVDNTHVRHWEYQTAMMLAQAFNYDVKVVSMYDAGLTDDELSLRGTHRVPRWGVAAQRKKWEGPRRKQIEGT